MKILQATIFQAMMCSALFLFGCASTKTEKASTAQTDPTLKAPSTKTLEVPQAAEANKPASAEQVRGMLMARHAEDLPTQEQLAAIDDAAASLVWVSERAKHLGTRGRALSLMRFYKTEDVRARLLEVLTTPSTHAKLVAAAITGTEAIDIKSDIELKAALDALADHRDPRVKYAISERLNR